MRTQNVNTNTKHKPKNERDCRKMFVSQRNITTHHNMSQTCHMRHICMPGDQIIKKYFCSRYNMLNATFQSHPIKMGCCNTTTKFLIVTTINPIWHSHPVHPGTKQFNTCSLKSKENIMFAQNFISEKQTQTKHLIALVFI